MSNSSLTKTLKSYVTLENILFVTVLGLIVFYFVFQTFILQTDNPQVAVTTTSMVPTYQGYDLTEQGTGEYYDILRGDLLIVQNIPPQVGDVIIFTANGYTTPIVHRIVAEKTVNNTVYFATKGDHNPYSDAGDTRGNDFGWIPRSAVLGVVVFAIHHLGWFSLQLQSPFLKVLLIVSVVALVILAFYESFAEGDKNKNNSSNDQDVNKKIRKVYLKIKNYKFRVNRPRVYGFIIFLVFLLSYGGIGMLNYESNSNTVQWLPKSSGPESNNIIDLRKTSLNRPEIYSLSSNNSLYFYNTQILINSSGTFNFVHKLVIGASYIMNGTKHFSPSYNWTIVYDYAGSKLIHAIFKFEIPTDIVNTTLEATLNFSLYSTGLLASSPFYKSLNVTLLV